MSTYRELSERAKEAFVKGELAKAEALFRQAETHAGSQEEKFVAFCNRCAVLAELDRLTPQLPRLRRVLLQSSTPKTKWMASYYLAMGYDLDGDLGNARRFALRAWKIAENLKDKETEAATLNMLGNLNLADSRFAEAEEAYNKALSLYQGEEPYRRLMRAQIVDNLGYAKICLDQVREGIRLCERSRAEMEELEAYHYLHQPLQDLCYGYLLAGDPQQAAQCGEEGLELARRAGDDLVVGNLLFLLAEAAIRCGDRFRAKRWLKDLERHRGSKLPPEMVELVMKCDLLRLVNLRSRR